MIHYCDLVAPRCIGYTLQYLRHLHPLQHGSQLHPTCIWPAFSLGICCKHHAVCCAALSQNLKDGEPLGVDILGSRIVLFRDAETKTVRCLDDTCPHRGAPLSDGWLAMDSDTGHTCVVCPYHGWAFDGEGRLRDVPSAEANKWPKRPVVNAYPVSHLAWNTTVACVLVTKFQCWSGY